MDDKEQKVTVADYDGKDLDQAYADLKEALEAKDDTKLNEALGALEKALQALLGKKDDGEDKKPDPFAEKVAKYAPHEGE